MFPPFSQPRSRGLLQYRCGEENIKKKQLENNTEEKKLLCLCDSTSGVKDKTHNTETNADNESTLRRLKTCMFLCVKLRIAHQHQSSPPSA